MKKKWLLPILVLLCACEKPIIGDEDVGLDGNLILKFSPYTQSSYTRAASSNLSGYMSKINIMLYNAGTTNRVFDKVKAQNADDSGFGTFSFTVPVGSYDVLAVGHSSYRSATLNKDKVAFTAYQGKKITDTFWYLGTVTVEESEETTVYDNVLNRVSAMFRLVIEDETPEEVESFKFEYTGGSADFNPTNGKGVTNSKQSEIREFNADGIYEVYTFPKDDNKLTVTVTALDANDNAITTKQFQDVPVTANQITTFKGNFFDGTAVVSGNGFSFTVNGDYEKENIYTY